MLKRWITILSVLFSLTASASSLYPLATLEQEQIFKKLLTNFRCLVCQNQNLLDSHSTLARDLRQEIYEKLQEGQTEQDIQQYLLSRYGEFVLYQPPLTQKTALLWFGPFIVLLIGVGTLLVAIRRQNAHA